jgi:DNA polymerase-3 subunit delta
VAKLDARRLAAFLADPGECRLVLLTGDDAGLIRERATALAQAVSGGEDLRLVELGGREAVKDPGLLAAEAATQALTGGRRAVWLRDAGDAHTNAAKQVLEGRGPGLVIMEAPELPGRSKLKALIAADPRGALIECWRERGAELAASAQRLLRELGAEAEPAALSLLAERAGEDRLLLRREAEKLALYAGLHQRITAEDVLAVTAEGGGLDLEEALLAATAGDVGAADRALARVFAEGAQPVAVLRAALRHIRRLQAAAQAMGGGASAAEAMERLRPPVFFRAKPAFEKALRRWNAARLETAGSALLRAERQAKSTGLPDAVITRQTILNIARL